jgi:hypothetical protein
VTDWTTVTTTLGAAGITGLLGYFGARWQGRVGLEQAHEETERLRTQYHEDHLRNRQQHYQVLLDEVSTFDRMRRETDAMFRPGSPEAQAAIDRALQDEKKRFNHVLNTVRLLGTELVREAADRVNRLYTEIQSAWWAAIVDDRKRGGEGAPGDAALIAVQPRMAEWDAAVAALLDSMRQDVAPAR